MNKMKKEIELTAKEEEYILEQGMDDYYNKKSPYTECINCKQEHKKEEMVETDIKGSNEWLCLECAEDLRDYGKYEDYCGCGNELDDDDYANVCKECK